MNKTLKTIGKAVLPMSMQLAWQVKRLLQRGASDAEVPLLPLFARSGSFVDIGANMGSWTGPASRVFRRVDAFEPYAELAAALRRAVAANVTVHEVALSDHEGSARFAVPMQNGEAVTTRATLEPGANAGYEEVFREVRLARLDSYALKGVDTIKIDVEGHEEATLEGARETIARERPTLIVEIEERHHAGRSEPIIASLVARDYTCCYLHRGRLELFEPGAIARLQPAALVPSGQGKSEAYINNFLFSPVERIAELDAVRRFLSTKAA